MSHPSQTPGATGALTLPEPSYAPAMAHPRDNDRPRPHPAPPAPLPRRIPGGSL